MQAKTPVLFYQEDDSVLAVFVEEQQQGRYGTRNGCYAHEGQHSLSDQDYHTQLPLATPSQYANLVKELTLLGYDLLILNALP